MKTITKKQFLADVMHEIEMLKSHATASEKSKLQFYDLDPSSTIDCIYGQMTGNCKSSRASQLIGLCCKRLVRNEGELDSLDDILPSVNGKYNKLEFERNRQQLDFLSSLEGYIMAEEANNQNVISYIKGETSTLSL